MKENAHASFRKVKGILAFNFVNFVLQYLYSSNLQVIKTSLYMFCTKHLMTELLTALME